MHIRMHIKTLNAMQWICHSHHQGRYGNKDMFPCIQMVCTAPVPTAAWLSAKRKRNTTFTNHATA